MAKEIFKNLPNTSTPLSASKLNGLFDGAESMGSIVVEDISCKNLFNKTNHLDNFNFSDGTITYNWSSYIFYAKCNPNTTYTISRTFSGVRFRVATTQTTPKTGVSVEDIIANDEASSITITTNKNAKYIVVYCYNATVDTSTTLEQALNGVQIEKGSVATNYVEYKEIGNKQHYSTEEQVIGTYLGKKLYRIVIRINSITTSNSDLANIQYLHIDDLVTLKGTIYTDVGSKFPIPLYDSANNYSVIFISEAGVLRGRASIGSGSLSKILVTLEYTKTTD